MRRVLVLGTTETKLKRQKCPFVVQIIGITLTLTIVALIVYYKNQILGRWKFDSFSRTETQNSTSSSDAQTSKRLRRTLAHLELLPLRNILDSLQHPAQAFGQRVRLKNFDSSATWTQREQSRPLFSSENKAQPFQHFQAVDFQTTTPSHSVDEITHSILTDLQIATPVSSIDVILPTQPTILIPVSPVIVESNTAEMPEASNSENVVAVTISPFVELQGHISNTKFLSTAIPQVPEIIGLQPDVIAPPPLVNLPQIEPATPTQNMPTPYVI